MLNPIGLVKTPPLLTLAGKRAPVDLEGSAPQVRTCNSSPFNMLF